MCSSGDKRFFFHSWDKWREKQVMMRTHRSTGMTQEIRVQERECLRCGLTQMKRINLDE